jgi:diacylglycerol kinase family enzyme
MYPVLALTWRLLNRRGDEGRVVNPVGGARRGERTYRDALEPALLAAGLVPELRLMRARGDARAIGRDAHLLQYGALVRRLWPTPCALHVAALPLLLTWAGRSLPPTPPPQLTVSGDGMLNEVVAGVWERPDRDEVLRTVVVAVYPAGTGNGLATSLGWPPGPALAQGMAAALQQATCTPLDVQEVVIGTHPARPALLSTAWGFVAEHDTWSERKLRWMGRFWATALAPVLAALRGRLCRGRLAFLPAPGQAPVRPCGVV